MARYAIVIPTLSGGGAEKVALLLANRLSSDGHQVDLLVFEDTGPLRERVHNSVHLVSLQVRNKWLTVFRLVRWLGKNRPQAVLSVMRYTNIVVSLAAWLSRCPCWLNEQNTLDALRSMPRVRRALYRWSMRFTYHLSCGVIANSHDTLADLHAERILAPSSGTVLPNPVELPALPVQPADHPWMRDPSRKVILGVGRLHPQKNFHFLIRAFARLHRQNPAVRLIIVGEGEEKRGLENEIASLNLQDAVALLSFRPDIMRYYTGADVFALTSRWEGFGNVLVEALACGTPVVSVACRGGPRMILDNGRYGTLVPPDDETAFAEALASALAADRETLAPLLRARAESFSVPTVTAQFEACLRTTSRHRSPADPPSSS